MKRFCCSQGSLCFKILCFKSQGWVLRTEALGFYYSCVQKSSSLLPPPEISRWKTFFWPTRRCGFCQSFAVLVELRMTGWPSLSHRLQHGNHCKTSYRLPPPAACAQKQSALFPAGPACGKASYIAPEVACPSSSALRLCSFASCVTAWQLCESLKQPFIRQMHLGDYDAFQAERPRFRGRDAKPVIARK